MVSDRSRIEGLPVVVTSGSVAVLAVDNPHANRRGVGIDTFGILVPVEPHEAVAEVSKI